MHADTTKHHALTHGDRDLHLADAGVDDAARIVGLLERAYAAFRPAFAPTALRETPATVAAAPSEWLLAIERGRLVGCVRHRREDGDYTFAFLAVPPDQRARGVGSTLVEAVAARATLVGADELVIVLRDGLRGNVEFFRRRGFRRDRPFLTGEHSVWVRPLGVTCPAR